MLGRKIIKGLLLLSLLLGAAVPGFAQGGGKAEPLRIEFKRGAESATLKGRVRRDEQAEYIFAARKGQQLTITVTSIPTESALFELLGQDNQFSPVYVFKGYSWSGIAPETRDYLIWVTKPDKKINSSSYSLTLKIK
jgi:hypothetical protein